MKSKLSPRAKETAPKPTGTRRRLVEQEILEQAASLFAERGYAGTTLKEVANALGTSRTALYYYIPSKEAILQRLVENLSGHDARVLGEIVSDGALAPPAQVEAMAYQVSLNASSNPQQTRILSESTHFFPPALVAANRKSAAQVVEHFRTAIEAGMSRGEFRPVNPLAAALSIVGMCIWTAWWMSDVERSAAQVAEQIAAQARRSLVADHARAGRSDADELIDSIESQLMRLRTLVASS